MGKRNAAALERPSHEVQSRVAIVGPGLRCHCGARRTICHTKRKPRGHHAYPSGRNWQLDCFFGPSPASQKINNNQFFLVEGNCFVASCFFLRSVQISWTPGINWSSLNSCFFVCVLQGSLMLLADLDLINWRFRWFRCVWSVWIFWKLRKYRGKGAPCLNVVSIIYGILGEFLVNL